MNTLAFVLVLAVYIGYSAAFPSIGNHVNGQLENGGKIWVLLAAGSNTYFNYRHQADVCHAYQVVHKNGIPDEQIIVMMYDDIAFDKDNPHKGILRNSPGGPNVYANVPKDYTGKHVDKFVFLNVLKGEKEKVKGFGSERVIESGPNDHIFVYFVDHGGDGFVLFPEFDRLYVDQLNDALKFMHQSQRYAKLVFYLEACESGSMFQDVLSSDLNVYAITAAKEHENSWATYCENNGGMNTCLGDEFSVAFLEESEKADVNSLLLEDQFHHIVNKTKRSHPQRYGNLTIAKEFPVGQFMGNKRNDAEKISEESAIIEESSNKVRVPSRDVPIHMMKMKIMKAKTEEESDILNKQLSQMNQKRKIVENTIDNIILAIAKSPYEIQQFRFGKTRAIDSIDCYKSVTTHFFQSCFPQSNYALAHMGIFANVCNFGLSDSIVKEAMDMVCPNSITHVL